MTKPILIAGPTASGKSELALQFAEANNGLIINADALQVYDCYRVLTARPDETDLARAPHALYGHVENKAGYSVGKWLTEVQELLAETRKTPIIVGGTGLYFKALTEGLAVIPQIDPSIRQELEATPLDELVRELEKVDPRSFSKIDLQNPLRVMRALEVSRGTDKPISVWQAETPSPLLPIHQTAPICLVPDVETTNMRIAHRFDKMIAYGALDEVRAQCDPWRAELPANKALGASELAGYIEGRIPLEEAKSRAITATRQYAKRQRSWFRSNMKAWRWISTQQQAKSFFL